jgi:hypothetical protein
MPLSRQQCGEKLAADLLAGVDHLGPVGDRPARLVLAEVLVGGDQTVGELQRERVAAARDTNSGPPLRPMTKANVGKRREAVTGGHAVAAKAPTVGVDAFKGVPFGAKAIRAPGLPGYGPNGALWNNLIVWTPGAVAAPTVTASGALLAQTDATMMITGSGFVAGKPSAHQVTFNNGAVGTVTAATATRLTVTFSTQPTSDGPLTAIVTSVGGKSGLAKQVAKVVLAPI